MKFVQKHKIILIHIAALVLILGLSVQFAEEIHAAKKAVYNRIHSEWFSDDAEDQTWPEPAGGQSALNPVENEGDGWYLEHPLIYHAGGEIHGSSYTNSLEAVENTLAENGGGVCFVEMDFRYTSDGALVCAHDWSDAVVDQTETPALEEFLSWKIQGKFTPLTAEHLMRIMAENPNMYLVTDKKVGSLASIIEDLVKLCGRDESVLSRLIIQLYTGQEKSEIQAIYPFDDDQFLLTIYQLGEWSWNVAQICAEEGIHVIVAPYEMWIPEEDIAHLNQLGFTLYLHTVNRADMAQAAMRKGIFGFYTDNLRPEDLMQ